MAGKKIFTDHEYQTSAHLVTPKVHTVANISSHAGVLGQLASSGNNLYFHDGSNWFALIESNYAGALTGRPNFDPASGNIPFTVGTGHTDRVDNLNADLLDGYDTSTSAVASKIPVYGTSGVLKVGTPVATGDATTKAYVDDLVQGLDIKASVAAASTGNLTLSGTQTVDGVSLSAGNRVLAKDQSVASQNGIYIVASGSWSLASDSDAGSLSEGAYVFVEAGTANNNTGWTYTDSASYTWAKFSGAGQLNAGDGLVKSGDTLNANVSSPISIVSDQITIADAAITGSKLANNTVTSTQLADSIQVSNIGVGTAPTTAPLVLRNSTDPNIVLGYPTGSNEHRISWDSSKLFFSADHQNNVGSSGMFFKVDGSTALQIESDQDAYFWQKLGIGGSPVYDVHVQRANARIAADNGTVETLLQADSTIGYVGTNTNHKLILKTNNTSRLEIENDGDVKVIGKLGVNTSPLSQTTASVNGTLQATMGRFSGWVSSGNSGTGLGLEVGISSGDGYVLAYNRTTSVYEDLRLVSNASQIHLSNVAGGSIEMSGKVGIGVSPDAALDIQGSTNLKTKIKLTNTNPSTDNVWSMHANYSDQTLQFMGDSTLALKLDDSGQVTVGTLATSTADNSLIVESSGLLKKRNANSGIWTTNLGANRFLVSNSSGVITSDSSFVHLGGRVSLTGAIDSGANLKVDIVDHDVTTNDTNHEKAIFAYASNGYNIASGVTDSGYRIAVDASAFVSDSDFEGTLTYQYGVLARHGAYTSASGSTITNSYGVYIDSLTNSNTTITNLYGLYQANSTAKNYFAGSVGIGATPDSTYKLIVNGKSKLQNDIVFSSANPRIDFASTSSGIRLYSTTSNAEKLRLTDSGLKLADISTSTSDTNVIVESSGLLKKRATHPGAFAATQTTNSTDLDSVSDGWYRWSGSGNQPTNAPALYNVMFQQEDASQKIQLAYGGSSYGKLFIRRADSGTFYDWTEFYSTENLTLSTLGGVGGSGTINKLPIWDGTSSLTDSRVSQTSSSIEILGASGQGYSKLLLKPDTGASLSLLELSHGSDPNNSSVVIYGRGDTSYATINSLSRGTGVTKPINFDIDGDEKMRIDTSGNVGIGTDDPQTTLEIFGGQYSSSYPSMLNVVDDETTFNTANNGGGISFGAKYTSSSEVRFIAGIQGVKANNTSGNFGGALRFLIRENGTSLLSEKMRVGSTGNVGIGTDSPAALIHGMSGDLFLTANSTSADSGQGIYFQSTTSGWATNSAHAAIFGKRVDASNGYLRFDTRSGGNTAERMRIDSSGNVGINCTPDTNYKLDVNGDARIGGNRTATSLLIEASDDNGAPSYTSIIKFKGYESRAQGIFFENSTYTGEEWFAGTLYNGAFNAFVIGYDEAGSQAEYDANYKFKVTTGGSVYTQNSYYAGNGNTTYPSFSFRSDPNTGMFRAGEDHLKLITGGTSRLEITSSGHATFSGTITSTDNANGSGDNIVVSTTNKDVNLYAISSKRSGTTVGGMRIDGRFHAASGSLTYPAYAFIDDANTGMFRAGSDHLQLTSGGTGRLRVSADVSVIGSTDLLVTGANRRLSFTSGTGTVRTTTAADLYLATNSTNRVQVTSAGAVKATRDGGSNLIQVARIHDGSLTGNDSATSFTITHNLETGKPIAVVIDDTSGAYVEAQIVVASNNAITVSFNDAPASGKVYRVPVTG